MIKKIINPILIIVMLYIVYMFWVSWTKPLDGGFSSTYGDCIMEDEINGKRIEKKGVIQKHTKRCQTTEKTACVFEWEGEKDLIRKIGVLKGGKCVSTSPGSSCMINEEKEGIIPTKKEFEKYDELCIEK